VDEWIIGKSPLRLRTYVVHTEAPRFILEIIELGKREWNAGALSWIDDPGTENAARWTKRAVDVFSLSTEMGRGA
jgi:hypothetical protein